MSHLIPWVSPETILPDKSLNAVAERARYIVSAEDFIKELEKVGLEQKRSLLTMAAVNTMYEVLEDILARPAPLQTILLKPSAVRLVPQTSSLPSTLPARESENIDPRPLAIIPGNGKKDPPLPSDAAIGQSLAKRKPLQELDSESVRKRVIKLPTRYRE